MTEKTNVLFFSEYFGIESDPNKTDDFFDIILNADLPVFVDPFLIYCSQKSKYQNLYAEIIHYLKFLSEKSLLGVNATEFNDYFLFKEVQETHLGFSLTDNPGKGLGGWFGKILQDNLKKLFTNPEKNTHLEKLCLIADKVGPDKISDFTINLIKAFLAEYTQEIAKRIPDKSKIRTIPLRRVVFNFEKEIWEDRVFNLPCKNGKYFLLIPRDILTRSDTWMNKRDLSEAVFEYIPQSLENEQLRWKLNQVLILDIKKDEKLKKLHQLIKENPEIIEAYIAHKEGTGNDAIANSSKEIGELVGFVNLVNKRKFSSLISDYSPDSSRNSLEEGESLIRYFKQKIENEGVWKNFWQNEKRVDEKSVQGLFKLTYRGSKFDITSEADNGTGPVDFKISSGSSDVTLIEFKLATNKKALPTKQLESYKSANNTTQGLIVVFCFSQSEVRKIENGIRSKGLKNAFLIDVTPKISASKL